MRTTGDDPLRPASRPRRYGGRQDEERFFGNNGVR